MPYLLTPETVTTSRAVELAMLADWGADDAEFIGMVDSIKARLLKIAGCDSNYECVLVEGSGVTAVEAALGTLVSKANTKTLVLANGAASDHAANVLERLARPFLKIDKGDGVPAAALDIEPLLAADKTIQHVFMVHCETNTGLVNPIAELGRSVKDKGRALMIDASATFGALPIDMVRHGIDVLIAASSHCLESVPGLAFVILRKELLTASEGNSPSMALDLVARSRSFLNASTHALAALHQALQEHEDDGGVSARGDRYARTASSLVDGMRAVGFSPLLEDSQAGGMVRAFHAPRDANYAFEQFRNALRARNFLIAPGAYPKQPTFRVAIAGKLDEIVIERFLKAVREVVQEQNLTQLGPMA